MKSNLNTAAVYVVANVAVSALGFLRNVLFMRSLGHGDLGQVAMLQTIVVVVGFAQLGLINGGYRLYAGADASAGTRINNNVMTSLAGAGALMLPALFVLQFIGGLSIANVEPATLLVGTAIGVLTMGATWLNNTLIAQSRLGLSSAINLGAMAVSLMVSLMPGPTPLAMPFLALLLQPACAVVLTLLLHAPSRPRPALDTALMRTIVSLGFAPYCAAIVALTNFQIERWFIVSNLGTEPMGVYYLIIVYSTIFTLIPISLLNLYFPRTVNAYEARNRPLFESLTRKHLLALVAYLIAAVAMTLALLPWTLEHHLPNYRGHQQLVYLALPGLMAYVLFDNVALVLQSAKKMLNLFLFALLALFLNVLALAWATAHGALTLERAATVKSASFLIAAAVMAADLFIRRRRLLAWS